MLQIQPRLTCRSLPKAALLAAILTTAGYATSVKGDVIYDQTFGGSSSVDLNGQSPTVNNSGGSVTWTAPPDLELDGVAASGTSAWLPYTFGDEIYELQMVIDQGYWSGAPSDRTWALAFTDRTGSFGTGSVTSSSQAARLFLRVFRNGGWSLNNNSGSVLASDTAVFGSADMDDMELKLVLDMSTPTATLAAYINGQQLDLSTTESLTRPVTPGTLTGVGFGNGGGNGLISSFTLSTIPEPASLALVGVGLMALVGRRRA